MNKEYKVLEFFFCMALEAKSVIFEDDLIKAINKNGIERIIPVERIELDTTGFAFTNKTFQSEEGMTVVVTKKNMFVFSNKYMKAYIKDNRNKVTKWNGYFLMKREDLPNESYFQIIEQMTDEERKQVQSYIKGTSGGD